MGDRIEDRRAEKSLDPGPFGESDDDLEDESLRHWDDHLGFK